MTKQRKKQRKKAPGVKPKTRPEEKPRIELKNPKKVEIELQYPVDLGDGKTITKVTLHRLKAKHLKLFPQAFFENGGKNIAFTDTVPIVAAMCEIDLAIAEEFDMSDITHISGELESFLSGSYQIG
ncbi:MAG: phage tail assembly protein [bacterium]|nr:phage tail assembly protein [bacterium]